MGEANVRAFLHELTTSAERYAEAMAHPGEGGAESRYALRGARR